MAKNSREPRLGPARLKRFAGSSPAPVAPADERANFHAGDGAALTGAGARKQLRAVSDGQVSSYPPLSALTVAGARHIQNIPVRTAPSPYN